MRAMRGLIATVGVLALGVAAVAAQGQGKDGFVAASDITRESLPATPLVYGAYGFVWLALITYVFLLWRRISKVEKELADVTAKLGARR